MQPSEFALRFCLGGLLVASIPVLARRVGSNVAGLLTLFPVVTLTSFYFVGADQGRRVLSSAVRAAFFALPVLAVYLGATVLALRTHLPIPVSLAIGLSVWLAAAIVAVKLI